MRLNASVAFALAVPLLLAGCDQKKEAANAPPAAPAAYRIYVTNELSNDVTVIDGASRNVIATVPVGQRPRGIRPGPDGKLLYITLSGSPIAGPGVDEDKLPPPDRRADGIAVFDVATNKVVNVLHGIVNPEQVAVAPNGKLFSGSEDDAQVEVLDAKTGAKLGSIPIPGSPEGVAVSPDGKNLLATSEDGEKVYVIDTATDAIVTSLPVGGRPRGVAYAPDGGRAYVTAEIGKSVTAIDARHNTLLSTIHLTGDPVLPMGVVVSPDNKRVYVTTGRGGNAVAIDADSLGVVKTIKVGQRPWGVALSPDGRYLFTANGPSGDISVVDTQSLTEIAKIKCGNRPWGVAVVAQAQ